MTSNHAARAQALVGTRFRAQGRGKGGLDCVGVVLATFGMPVDSVRSDYRLRGDHLCEVCGQLGRQFRKVPRTQMKPGDVLLLALSDDQLHLAIRTKAGFVHAHAGIRRVVETPGLPEWPLVAVYRKRRSS